MKKKLILLVEPREQLAREGQRFVLKSTKEGGKTHLMIAADMHQALRFLRAFKVNYILVDVCLSPKLVGMLKKVATGNVTWGYFKTIPPADTTQIATLHKPYNLEEILDQIGKLG